MNAVILFFYRTTLANFESSRVALFRLAVVSFFLDDYFSHQFTDLDSRFQRRFPTLRQSALSRRRLWAKPMARVALNFRFQDRVFMEINDVLH